MGADIIKFPRLTKELISQSRVIAKGENIRDIERLIRDYGGSISKWKKKSSPVIIVLGKPAEIHWYENPDVGRVEEKIKWIQ